LGITVYPPKNNAIASRKATVIRYGFVFDCFIVYWKMEGSINDRIATWVAEKTKPTIVKKRNPGVLVVRGPLSPSKRRDYFRTRFPCRERSQEEQRDFLFSKAFGGKAETPKFVACDGSINENIERFVASKLKRKCGAITSNGAPCMVLVREGKCWRHAPPSLFRDVAKKVECGAITSKGTTCRVKVCYGTKCWRHVHSK
jgi:hypothetical protein